MHLSTSGLKGYDLDLELGPRTIVTGGNASGKTSVADALAIIALGWVPRLGRTPAATAALLRGRELKVRLVLDDGRWMERTLRQKAKGGYETETRVSWCDATRSEEHEAEALALFGRSAEEVGQAIDISQLLTLTGNQRAAALQELLEQGNDPAALARAVARRWVQTLADVDDDRMAEIEDHTQLRPLISGYDADGQHSGRFASLAATAPLMAAKIAEVGISGATTWANAEKRLAAAGLREKTAARAELAARLREIPEPDGAEMARLEEQRAELDRQIGAASEREAAVRRQADAVRQAQTAVEIAWRALERATVDRSTCEAAAPRLPAWQQELADVVVALEALVPPPAPNYDEVEALEAAAAQAAAAAAAIALPSVPDLQALQAAVEQARAALDRAASSPWDRVRVVAADVMAALERHRRGWPKVVEKVGGQMAELQALAAAQEPASMTSCLDALQVAEAALAEAEAAAEQAGQARSEALARRAELEAAARAGRADAAAARAKLAEEHRAARAEYDQARAYLESERDRLRPLVNGATDRDRASASALEAATAAHAAAKARLADLTGIATGDADEPAGPSVAELRGERERVHQQLGVLTRAEAAHAECRRLVDEIDRLKTTEGVMVALEGALQRVRAEELAHGGGPLIRIMCEILAGAGRSERPYIRAEKAVCELGWRTPRGDEVPVQALSGAEHALFASALAAAVITLRGAAVRILCVESAEAVDHPRGPQSLSELLAGLAAADERLVCVVLTPTEPSAPAIGWKVVRLSGREQAKVAA